MSVMARIGVELVTAVGRCIIARSDSKFSPLSEFIGQLSGWLGLHVVPLKKAAGCTTMPSTGIVVKLAPFPAALTSNVVPATQVCSSAHPCPRQKKQCAAVGPRSGAISVPLQ